ncbi:Arylacetamide deacetylase [Pleurostoma richardsiae]|uniref:Arylacetamide deacetylase n=1 Tax=Pleurostoma richardsiae TaxID=41990 RepID=A0AA38VQ34_9PEZI|nr:Arylacetamide deacetylase [Pleurostoma richardsiae]
MAELVRIATAPDEPTAPEPPDSPEEYMNPLETTSRWLLSARAYAIRSAASLAYSLSNRQSPSAPSSSRVIYLDSRLSKHWTGKGEIRVDVYIPDGGGSNGSSISVGADTNKRPAIINLHGGGFVLGQGTDDARWAGAAMDALGAVVFAVNYRLAPSYPFPTAVEDSADAILQIADRAREFGIDPDKILLSGFSAGGNLALAAWVLLQSPAKWDYTLPCAPPRINGFVLYYPLLDWTLSRPRKRMVCPRPEMTLPKGLTDLFDASYIYPPRPRHELTDPLLSPGLMPDELLDLLPPLHLVLCEFDMLLIEGQMFAERLRARGKEVTVRVVKDAKHGWDKPPPLLPKESATLEYAEAIKSIAEWLAREEGQEMEEMDRRADDEKARMEGRARDMGQSSSSSSSSASE